MKIDVIASTHPNYQVTKEEFDNFSGKVAGVCYMPNTFNDLLNENETKTSRRVAQTKNSGHHSVYDHDLISLYIENIPKALAMVLNNENMYTTSEKSARYTKMVLKKNEQKLYDKWLGIYKTLIKEKYQIKYPGFFTESKIEKLAQENARYLISVFTLTSMVYTVSYRQLNYLYAFMQKEINREEQNKFYKLLTPAMQDFCVAVENSIPYLDKLLQDNEKNRTLSFMRTKNAKVQEYFGDVYATSYNGSFAQLAQSQRHRTINYSVNLLDKNEFYVPPILKDNIELTKEWIADCEEQAEVFPQGMLIEINEFGTLDNFILKMKERKCTFAQLEINEQVTSTFKEYVEHLKMTGHPRADELMQYSRGARCTFPDYKCKSPCGFKEGVLETREI